jgi:hypothetical protein
MAMPVPTMDVRPREAVRISRTPISAMMEAFVRPMINASKGNAMGPHWCVTTKTIVPMMAVTRK